jgi:glycosyltransferase involved in cell wall biosynthesis
MNCSLIITTYNRPEALILVLLSILKQTIFPDEIIIADDGSNQDTKYLLEEFSKQYDIKVIHSWQKDKGFRLSKSRNQAIALAKSEYIVVIDGDMVMHKDFIKDHKKFAKKNTYIQGGRVLLQSGYTAKIIKTKQFIKPSFFKNDTKNKANLLRIPFLSSLIASISNKNIKRIRGCNFSLFKKDIIKVNGFNEEFKSWGKEDSEFVQRLFNIGVYRRDLKFSGIQYHLFHPEGCADSGNIDLLNKSINENLSWCENGINKYF